METRQLTPDDEYRLTRAVAWGFWITAIVGALLRVTNVIGIEYGLFIIVAMGLGIYFSMALSRFKLAATVRDVFLAGLTAATSLAGRTEAKLREVHVPTSLRDDLPAEVCRECAQRYPCTTVRIMNGDEASIVTEQVLTHPADPGSI